MKMDKPQPREEYKNHLSKLEDRCAFCEMSPDLNIKEYKYWIWAFSAFPYRKQHTLLIPKRHILRFSDLLENEILELKKISEDLEVSYRKSKIISEKSEFGDQIFMTWRSRENSEKKAPVAHFHIHVYPKFAEDDDVKMDKNSWDIDMNLLRSSI